MPHPSFNDTPGPQNLYEAGVMLVALAGALDEAMLELASMESGGKWLERIRENAVRAAKGTTSPSGTPEELDARATRKAVHLLQTLLGKVAGAENPPAEPHRSKHRHTNRYE